MRYGSKLISEMTLDEAEQALSKNEWRKCSSFFDSYSRGIVNRALKNRIKELKPLIADCKDRDNNAIKIDVEQIKEIKLINNLTKIYYKDDTHQILHKDCYEYLRKIIDLYE
jgi:hypothetical protein